LAIAADRFALKSQTGAGQPEISDECGRLALAHGKRTLRVRAVVIGVLEELPYICPVAVAIGSLIIMGMTLWKDWPQ
jgi:hypothetical protein